MLPELLPHGFPERFAVLMKIRVEAYGSLRRHVPVGTVVDEAYTVGQAIERLNLPTNSGLVMLLNGQIAHWNTSLQDGDVLQLVPVLAGG